MLFASAVYFSGSANFAAEPEKFNACNFFCLALYTIATPTPPMPDINGSTTFKVDAIATIASKAFPPLFKILIPAKDANG